MFTCVASESVLPVSDVDDEDSVAYPPGPDPISLLNRIHEMLGLARQHKRVIDELLASKGQDVCCPPLVSIEAFRSRCARMHSV